MLGWSAVAPFVAGLLYFALLPLLRRLAARRSPQPATAQPATD